MFAGCPICRAGGRIAAVEVRYDYEHAVFQPLEDAPGIWKWGGLMPRVLSRTACRSRRGTLLC